MEHSEVHQISLYLYQENPWLCIIHTLQRVIIPRGRRIIPFFVGKIHHIQLSSTPQITNFSWNTNLPTNCNLSPPIIAFIMYSVCLYSTPFFLIVSFNFSCTCYLLNTLKHRKNYSACEAEEVLLLFVWVKVKYCWRYNVL